MKDFSKQLSGQIGENLAVAELGRRGVVATTFAGNVPDIDVVAYRSGKSISIQVKASKRGSLSVNAQQFLEIELRGDVQIVKGKRDIDTELVFIIVIIGECLGADKFYICNQGDIQDIIYHNHSSFLEKHNGIRPRNPSSMHCAYGERDLEQFQDNWVKIEELLGS